MYTPNVLTEKIPAAKISTMKDILDERLAVSPSNSLGSLEDEVITLRARNTVLLNTLKSIKETAAKEKKRHHDLVWYARNRSRFPNHPSRKRIETDAEHADELQKLTSAEADYFHGIHSGILAATRVFEKQADILHVNEDDDVGAVLSAAAKHDEKIVESLESYPQLNAHHDPELMH
jgi:methionyl-tRNA formyltransferase